MEAKHTPGPWKVVDGSGKTLAGDGFDLIGGCGCCGSPWINGETEVQEFANALLIAAAPDLLESAQSVNISAVLIPGVVDEYAVSGEALRALIAAIAKAQPQEGGEA